MNSKQQESSPPPPSRPLQPQLFLQQAFSNLQNHFSNFVHQHHHHQNKHFNFNPNPSALKTHVESTFSNLQNHAKNAIEAGLSNFRCGPASVSRDSSGKTRSPSPTWARVSEKKSNTSSSNISPCGGGSVAMSKEAIIEERLAGVPVYALSNSSEEFVLVSGLYTGKSLGLFCFKEEDADTLLQQMKSMDPQMRQGSKVVAVALNKVFQLQVDGVSFRLIPEPSQVKNALKERQRAGFSDDSFSGIPVFQSKSLILRSQNKRYRPVFFRKEDLDNSLVRASHQQKHLNPSFREGDVQVAVLEDIIQGMKDTSTSNWDDVVFIPPGFDVSTDPS